MRCPACNFICSNKRDLCPKCTLDLRPHKKALGLPVLNPDFSSDELREIFAQEDGFETSDSPALAVDDEAIHLPDDLNDDINDDIKVQGKRAGLFSKFFRRRNDSPPYSFAEESPIINLAAALPETQEAPIVEAAPNPGFEKQLASLNELIRGAMNPTVAPAVMEFGDDDESFAELLDSLVGDEDLNVQAVNVRPAAKPIAPSLVDEDDFEVEFDLDEDPQLLSAELAALEAIAGAAQEIEIAAESAAALQGLMQSDERQEELEDEALQADLESLLPEEIEHLEVDDFDSTCLVTEAEVAPLSVAELAELFEGDPLDMLIEFVADKHQVDSDALRSYLELFLNNPQPPASDYKITDLPARHEISAAQPSPLPTEEYRDHALESAEYWVEAEEELAELEEMLAEGVLFEESQFVDLSKDQERLALLFDLCQEELEAPTGNSRYITNIETSADRRLDNYQLTQQFEKIDRLVTAENLAWDTAQMTVAPAEDYNLDFMLKPAELWRRVVANSIDCVVAILLALMLGLLGGFSESSRGALLSTLSGAAPVTADLLLLTSETLLLGFLVWGLMSFCLQTAFSRTWGKSLLRLELSDLSGFPPTWTQCLLRCLMAPLNVASGGLTLLPALYGKRRSLADIAAGTMIIRQPNSQ